MKPKKETTYKKMIIDSLLTIIAPKTMQYDIKSKGEGENDQEKISVLKCYIIDMFADICYISGCLIC